MPHIYPQIYYEEPFFYNEHQIPALCDTVTIAYSKGDWEAVRYHLGQMMVIASHKCGSPELQDLVFDDSIQ